MPRPEPTQLDFVTPCIVCGATCLGTYAFRASAVHVEVDRPALDERIETVLSIAMDDDGCGYAQLPAFIRHWNEGTGVFEDDGGPLDSVDLRAALELMKSCDKEQDPRPVDHCLDALVERLDAGLEFVLICS